MGNPDLEAVKGDYQQRLEIITKALFRNTFHKIAYGLQAADVLVYALRLAQIMSDQQSPLGAGELDLLLKGASIDVTRSSFATLAEQCKDVLPSNLNDKQLKGLQDLMCLPCFHNLVSHMKSNESA